MPSFAGRFQILNSDGTAGQAAPCQASFDAERMTLAPATGAPLAFDLGDIDEFHPADYELSLKLYTGQNIVLREFGKAFQNLCHDLLGAYRNRLVHCLLLEDLEELTRAEGFARLDSAERRFAQPAEVRLYKSNFAVLPAAATGFQWRLADIEAVDFEVENYALTIRSGADRLVISKLAKRTDEFRERLLGAMTELSARSAAVVQRLFPFLSPAQRQQAAEILKDGRSAPVAALIGIHRRIGQALVENAVDADLRPYFEFLSEQALAGGFHAGFKLIRRETDDAGGEAEEAEAAWPAGADEGAEVLHWFFFPLRAGAGAGSPANVVAWEATSRSGRATYLFRLLPPGQAAFPQESSQAPVGVDAAVRRLNKAIALLNFRREPIYLPDDSLELQPRLRRYAIACRKIPALRELRAQFLGRALHTSAEAWKQQLDALLAKA